MFIIVDHRLYRTTRKNNNFEEVEKQISRKVFTRRDVGDAGPRHVGVFARSPAAPLINTEHPSILNERVLHYPLLLRDPARLPFFATPPVSTGSRVRQLQCCETGERGRETNGGEGWEGLGLFRDDGIDRSPTPRRP